MAWIGKWWFTPHMWKPADAMLTDADRGTLTYPDGKTVCVDVTLGWALQIASESGGRLTVDRVQRDGA